MSFRGSCGRCQRELARLAILGREPKVGSRLARHVASCSECEQAWQELREAACRLSRLPNAPVLSPAFDAALMARVRAAGAERAAARPAFGTGAWALSLGITAALVVCAFWPHTVPVEKPMVAQMANATGLKTELHGRVRRNEFLRWTKRVAASQAHNVMERVLSAGQSHFPAQEFIPAHQRSFLHLARVSPPHHRHWRKATLLAQNASDTRLDNSSFIRQGAINHSPTTLVLIRRATWRESGAVYEASGDYVSAAQAYRKASIEQPDNAELILAAAVNAERAEDRGQALESYALLLAQNTGTAPKEAVNATASQDKTDLKPIEEHNHNEANKQP